MTDESIAARKFADRLFDYTVVMAENDLEDILHEQLLSPDFDKFGYITWDDYDRSLELYGAVDGLVLPEALVQWLWDQGFSRCWTNHENQTQTYYVSPKLTGHNYEQSPHRAKVVSAASEKRTRNSKLAAENAELRKALASPEVLRASSGSLISIDAVAAEPRSPSQDQSTRNTPCKRCGGTGMVDDGELTHYEGTNIPYENGPIKCVKDCPACDGRNATPF